MFFSFFLNLVAAGPLEALDGLGWKHEKAEGEGVAAERLAREDRVVARLDLFHFNRAERLCDFLNFIGPLCGILLFI